MDEVKRLSLPESYDRVAEEYVRRIYDELAHKPLDRELLDRFAARVTGPVCDLGCGPGHVARYLRDRGVDVFGLDISPGMVDQARRLNPDLEFRVGDMRALDANDAAWGGIVAFYSLIHIPREKMVTVLQELRRVLRPQGLLLLSLHRGLETVHRDELWGCEVDLDFLFHERDEVTSYLQAAGFDIEDVNERAPYEDVEYPSHRVYILARNPVKG